MTRLARALGAASLALTQIAAQAQSDPSPLTAERAPEVAYIVRGIVQYTRWSPPRLPIRLCVSDAMDAGTEAAFARAIADAKDGAAAITLSDRRLAPGATLDGSDCHVVLVNSTAPAQWRGLLPSLLGRQVLTIGFDEEFCSLGGMFCLENASGRLQIRANLDAISRSGMRINPQLLRLTQQRNGR